MLIVGGIFVETPGTCYRDVKMVAQMIASLLNISQLLSNHISGLKHLEVGGR